MDPFTIATVGFGIAKSFGSFFGGQDAARAENKARIKQFKQQMLIRQVRDANRFQVYNTQKQVYNQNLGILDKRFARMQMQDDLRMNELLKGAKLAGQNDLIRKVKAGSVTARVASGRSAAKLKQSALAEVGRSAANRQEQLLTSTYAKQMKDVANRESLYAAKQKEFNKVRFAPQESVQQRGPAMVSGPSPMSLISDIGSSVLGGISSFQNTSNFNNSIESGNYLDIARTPVSSSRFVQ